MSREGGRVVKRGRKINRGRENWESCGGNSWEKSRDGNGSVRKEIWFVELNLSWGCIFFIWCDVVLSLEFDHLISLLIECLPLIWRKRNTWCSWSWSLCDVWQGDVLEKVNTLNLILDFPRRSISCVDERWSTTTHL